MRWNNTESYPNEHNRNIQRCHNNTFWKKVNSFFSLSHALSGSLQNHSLRSKIRLSSPNTMIFGRSALASSSLIIA